MRRSSSLNKRENSTENVVFRKRKEIENYTEELSLEFRRLNLEKGIYYLYSSGEDFILDCKPTGWKLIYAYNEREDTLSLKYFVRSGKSVLASGLLRQELGTVILNYLYKISDCHPVDLIGFSVPFSMGSVEIYSKKGNNLIALQS